MSDLITFLTSEEIIVVYVIVGVACLLCLSVYITEKTYYRRRRRMNTKELNQLVMLEQYQTESNIDEENPVVEISAMEEKREDIPNIDEKNLVVEVSTMEEKREDIPNINEKNPVVEVSAIEEKREDIPNIEQQAFVIPEPVSEVKPIVIVPEVEEKSQEVLNNKVLEVEAIDSTVSNEESFNEEIQYENIEPDRTVAQAELERLAEELKRVEESVQNIELTEFEAEQEENAIISLEELLAKGDLLYEKNELTQYEDEGNEPISIQEIEKKMKEIQESTVIMEEEKKEPVLTEEEQKSDIIPSTMMHLDDFNTVKVEEPSKAYQGTHHFKNSPVISPIYGIEKKPALPKQTELELENTANYEKLDEEIRKTNEFIMTLKELQKKLD